MRVTRTMRSVGLGLAAMVLCSGAAMAQQGMPAETPPASYTGDQYTDSRGCVFVRAGIGGNTSWVPRVGRDRQQICGYQPSLGGATATVEAPAAAAPREGVVVIGATGSTGAAGTTRPATVTAPVRTAAPAPTAPPAVRVVRQTPPAVRTVTAPRVVQQPAPPATTSVRGGCPNLPRNAQPFFNGPNPRCGPQAVHPGDAARGIDRSSAVGVPAPVTVEVPQGYRLAWRDDRLNPMRGVGTAVGDAQMRQIWTDDVPMARAQPRVPVVATPTASTRSVATPARSQAATPQPPTQTASAPQIRVPADHRHVLAATYADRADADRAYARLAASGLPARLGQIDRASGMVYAVVAGPFASSQSLVQGLQATRAAGFSAAVTRR